jgi:hypothetical protein
MYRMAYDNTPLTPVQRRALENKAKSGWKMYFMMKEQHDLLADFMEYERESNKQLISDIKSGEEIDITHLKNQFVELYEKVNSQMECPVCFEILTKDKLDVPNCGHLICKSCKETICKGNCSCPICKKKYFVAKSR